jgi:hypothetical protein
MQRLVAAAGPLLLSLATLGLLAVMAADSWLGCDAPMPTHPLIALVMGPLLAARLQRWQRGNAKLPSQQVSAVLAALAAVVLCLCCKQRRWSPSSSKQPSNLVVGLAWVAVTLHSAKYAAELCMTGLTRSHPWAGVYRMLAIAVMAAMVSEPRCISVLIAVPYMMHELDSAGYLLLFTDMSSRQLGSTVVSIISLVVVGSLAGWFVYCGIVQRTIPPRMGLLVAALVCSDHAAYCSTSGRGFCVVEYDQTLDAFYALAEGTRPWLVLFKAGGAAFVVAAAGLWCGFAVLFLVTRSMRGPDAMGMLHIASSSNGLDSHVPHQQLQAAAMVGEGPVSRTHNKYD